MPELISVQELRRLNKGSKRLENISKIDKYDNTKCSQRKTE